MKMNTTFVIGLCFSVIIAIKAVDGVKNQIEKIIEDDEYEYTPSKTLMEMEDSLPECDRELVEDGMVKETICSVFSKSMKIPVAKVGWSKLRGEWNTMLEGPEASRVVGTFGKNLHKMVTNNKNGNIINVMASTLHGLLRKIAVEHRAAELKKIMDKLSELIGSDNTPNVINELGKLTIQTAEKPRAPEFIRKFFEETQMLLDVKNINGLLDRHFNTLISMMKSDTLRKKALEYKKMLESNSNLLPKQNV